MREIFVGETFVEIVVTGGHGSVHGVESRSAHQLESGVEVETLLLHIVGKTLEVEKCGVAFVCVIYLRLDAEFLEREHTADTEQILLLDTVFPVTAIELVGDGTVKLAVHVKVCVEQIELHAAHIHTPDVAVDDAVVIRHLKYHGVAVLLKHLLDGELVEVLGLVVGYLLAVDAECLGEIAVTVEKADGGHVDARVGCFLDIVAGEHTEAAGVDFETVAETILHGEI